MAANLTEVELEPPEGQDADEFQRERKVKFADEVVGQNLLFPDGLFLPFEDVMPDMSTKKVGKAYLAGDTLIHENSQAVVFAEFTKFDSQSKTLFLEPGLNSDGLMVAKSIHAWGVKRQCCTIINLAGKDVCLKKGTFLGTLFAATVTGEEDEIVKEDEGRMKVFSLDEKIKMVSELNIGINLSSLERDEIIKLLVCHFDEFQWDPDTIGRTHMVEHCIDTGTSVPIVQRQYPIPTVAKDAMRAQVKDMLRKGFIRESSSSWRSPVLLIKKVDENGKVTYRFCIDLRKVNDQTVKDRYMLPRIDETVDALSGSRFFSTMDVDRAFWQVGLKETDKCKTAFVVDGQLFEFNVMPFGASNAPATFQRLMDKALRGLTWHQCIVYIDDVLVFAKSFEAHLANLDLVLTRIKAAGLKLKPSKCKFADNRVDYLGFSISDKGRQPSRRKVEALLKVEPPNTNKALMSFLLSINYYRCDIPRFGELTVDLFDLANSKKRLCVWSEKLVANFKELQQSLANAPILAFPVFELPFLIQGDASKKAIGGANLQGDQEVFEKITKVRPVNFFGRKLTPTEQRWDTMCRELLALVYGYECSLHFVYGRHIVFLTDHEPLVTLKNLKNPLGRIGRLLNRLQGVDYEIRYVKGKDNHIADFMSRVEHPGDPIPIDVNFVEFTSMIDWRIEQLKDIEIQMVISLLSSNGTEAEWRAIKNGNLWWRVKDDLYVVKEVLKINSGQIVVPEALVPNVLTWHHDSPFAGHRGSDTMLAAVRFRYYWNLMPTVIKEFCRECEKCQKFNYSNLASRAPLGGISAQRRNEFLELDFMGPFRKTRNGNEFIVLGIDVFTKYLEGVATISFDALISALFIFNVIYCRHGPYEKVLTDRGRNFESKLFFQICHLMGAKKLRTTAFHAQCNGGIERVNKVIKPCLAKLLDTDQDDWDIYLPMAISSYNNSHHSSIGLTPFEAHYGRPSVMIQDIVLNNPLTQGTRYTDVNEYVVGLWENASRIQGVIRENIQLAKEKQKLAYDKYVNESRQYAIGDSVKLKNFAKIIGKSTGFLDKHLGPFVITGIRGLTYTVMSPDGLSQTVHYNRMMPYYIGSERVIAYDDAPVIPRFGNTESLDGNASSDKNYVSETHGIRTSSRLLLKLKAAEKGRLLAMQSIQRAESADVASVDENYEDSNDHLSSGNEEDGPNVVNMVVKEKIGVSDLVSGSPNKSNKATKVCPGCMKPFEAKQGIKVHARACIMFMEKFELVLDLEAVIQPGRGPSDQKQAGEGCDAAHS